MDLSTLEAKYVIGPATTILVFFLGLISSAICGALIYRFWKYRRLIYELEQGASLEERKIELKQDRSLDEWYHFTLNSGLDAADRFFGHSLISFRAYGVCLTLAVIYPIVLFIGNWTLTGNARLGGLSVFEEQVGWYRRGILLPLLIVYGFAMFRLYSYIFRPDRGILPRAVAVAGVYALAGAGTLFSGFSMPLSYTLLLLFLAFLPMVNSLLDFISWAITRGAGRLLQNHFSRGLAVALGMADLGVAIILLATLAFALGMGFTVMNAWLPFEEALDFEAIVQSAAEHPFGEGLWITFMLASTLIPTGIHFFLVVLGFVGKRRDSRRQQSWIEELDGAIDRNKEISAAIERGDEVSEVQMRHAQVDSATCREIAHELVATRLIAFGAGSAILVTFMGGVMILLPAVLWDKIITGLVWCAELGEKAALYLPGVS